MLSQRGSVTLSMLKRRERWESPVKTSASTSARKTSKPLKPNQSLWQSTMREENPSDQ